VRGVTAVASHPKIHAMTEIDYREYYIQNTAGTTPDAAGSRMDRDFYRGASAPRDSTPIQSTTMWAISTSSNSKRKIPSKPATTAHSFRPPRVSGVQLRRD